VSFIDFEFAAFNYQAFDIATHFCEYAGWYFRSHDADLGGQDPKNMDIVPESAMMFIIEFLS